MVYALIISTEGSVIHTCEYMGEAVEKMIFAVKPFGGGNYEDYKEALNHLQEDEFLEFDAAGEDGNVYSVKIANEYALVKVGGVPFLWIRIAKDPEDIRILFPNFYVVSDSVNDGTTILYNSCCWLDAFNEMQAIIANKQEELKETKQKCKVKEAGGAYQLITKKNIASYKIMEAMEFEDSLQQIEFYKDINNGEKHFYMIAIQPDRYNVRVFNNELAAFEFMKQQLFLAIGVDSADFPITQESLDNGSCVNFTGEHEGDLAVLGQRFAKILSNGLPPTFLRVFSDDCKLEELTPCYVGLKANEAGQLTVEMGTEFYEEADAALQSGDIDEFVEIGEFLEI